MTEFDGLPVLRSPVAIAAFEGWNDAADASTAAVEHLEQVWDAREIAALDPEEFYDFQVNRPDDHAWPRARPAASSGRPPGSGGHPARHRPRRRADPRHRAQHALAHVLRAGAGAVPQPRGDPGRAARRAARRRARTPGRCRSAAAPPARTRPSATSSPRPGTTARPASSACCRTPAARRGRRGLVLGARAALRQQPALPQGDPRAAAPGRGGPRPAGADGRPRRGVGGVGGAGAHRRRAGRRARPSTSASSRSAPATPACSRSPATRSPSEFEKYLRRRGGSAGPTAGSW